MGFFSTERFEWRIGLRYTRAGKRSMRNGFISFSSMSSMLGIGLGVAALIIVMSVMNGFQKEVRDRMLSVLAHIEVFDGRASEGAPDPAALQPWAEQIGKHPQVRGIAPFVEAQAMLMNGETLRGVLVRGIVPQQEAKVSEIHKQMRQGGLDLLKDGSFHVVLGRELARILRVEVGDKITIIAPQGQVTPAGVSPRLKQFTVMGLFDSGHYEFDSTFAYIALGDAQKLFRDASPLGLRVKIADMQQAPEVSKELAQSLPAASYVRDWTSQNRSWFAAVKTEKRMMFIILSIIVAVAAFNLVSTLVMTVTDKQADIAILRTLGASPASIMQIFIIQGSLIGLLGAAGGVIFGVLVALNVGSIVSFIEGLAGVQFLPKDIYLISSMPSDLHWEDVIYTAAIAIALSFAATIYPSLRAARVRPAEALRYE
ncbi:lipoprotein-releasing ABC transporter permease subunit [Massilia sp. W12]|uniref:lipoprotein-releasing ABC transporter permease subunit n=1 Tax=Massilia sp. W12 TaxID=3126507 RepID=UPI0030CF6F87